MSQYYGFLAPGDVKLLENSLENHRESNFYSVPGLTKDWQEELQEPGKSKKETKIFKEDSRLFCSLCN
jgi:hypothetical protein